MKTLCRAQSPRETMHLAGRQRVCRATTQLAFGRAVIKSFTRFFAPVERCGEVPDRRQRPGVVERLQVTAQQPARRARDPNGVVRPLRRDHAAELLVPRPAEPAARAGALGVGGEGLRLRAGGYRHTAIRKELIFTTPGRRPPPRSGASKDRVPSPCNVLARHPPCRNSGVGTGPAGGQTWLCFKRLSPITSYWTRGVVVAKPMSLIAVTGRGAGTADFRTDYLCPAAGELQAQACVRRACRSTGVVDADVLDSAGRLVATGPGKAVQAALAPHGQGRRSGERGRARLLRRLARVHRHVLGTGAAARECRVEADLVAEFEARHFAADRDDDARGIEAERGGEALGSLRGHDARAQLPVDRVDASRDHAHQQVAGAAGGYRCVFELHQLGPAVGVDADGFHVRCRALRGPGRPGSSGAGSAAQLRCGPDGTRTRVDAGRHGRQPRRPAAA